MGLWLLSPAPGTELLTPLEFPSGEADKRGKRRRETHQLLLQYANLETAVVWYQESHRGRSEKWLDSGYVSKESQQVLQADWMWRMREERRLTHPALSLSPWWSTVAVDWNRTARRRCGGGEEDQVLSLGWNKSESSRSRSWLEVFWRELVVYRRGLKQWVWLTLLSTQEEEKMVSKDQVLGHFSV